MREGLTQLLEAQVMFAWAEGEREQEVSGPGVGFRELFEVREGSSRDSEDCDHDGAVVY